jgi:hypothetical protein
MTKRRAFLIALAAGLWPTLATAALDGHWPDFSAMHWAVFLAGSCVIAVAFILLEDKLRSRRDETDSR